MLAGKIKSVVMAVSFLAFLVCAGLAIGLTFVSAFSTGAAAMTSISPHFGPQVSSAAGYDTVD